MHSLVRRGLFTASLAPLAACSSPGPAATTEATDTGTGTSTLDTGSTAASASTIEPTTSTTGSTTADATSSGTSADPTTGVASTDATSNGSTGSTGTTGDSTSTGSTGTTGDSTSTGTTGDSTSTGSTGDSTTGDTGGAPDPFFPPCDQLEVTGPITFEDLAHPSYRRTPATLAWDGQDIVVVRDDFNLDTDLCETVFERRDLTGTLLGPPVRGPSAGICEMNGSLGHDPVSDTFLFTHQIDGYMIGLTGLDAAGNPLWQATGWEVCNSIMNTIDVASRGGEFVVMGERSTCAADGSRRTSAAVYTPDGVKQHLLQTATATVPAGDAACDLPACDRLITLRYGVEGNMESGIYAQMGDLVDGGLDVMKTKIDGVIANNWQASAAAHNGSDWLLVRIGRDLFGTFGHVRRWDEALGWTTGGKTFSTPGTVSEIELLWTGHDYVGVYAEYPWGGSLNDSWYQFDIYLLLIGPDGVIKQHEIFERPDGHGGYAPQIVALPGAIGLSWVRVDDKHHHSRHLARIECVQ